MRAFANSEDPDEMPHNVKFHQGLHFLKTKNDLHRKKIFLFVIYTVGHAHDRNVAGTQRSINTESINN